MQLTEIQRRYVRNLNVGQAVVQHAGNKPVPVNLRYVDVEKQVSDEELKDHQEEKWDELEWTRRQDVDLDFDNPEPSKDSDLGKYLD
jgi:L-rhamnose isomerase